MAPLPTWLLDEGVHSIVESVVGAIIAIGAAAITRSLLQRGEVQTGAASGRTRQSPEILVVGVLCAAVSLICLFWGLLEPSTLREPGAASAWLSLIAGFASAFAFTAVYAQHQWTWNEAGITWKGAFRQTTIDWSNIKRAGKSWDGQYVARDGQGHVIRWTSYTLAHEALGAAVEAALARSARRAP